MARNEGSLIAGESMYVHDNAKLRCLCYWFARGDGPGRPLQGVRAKPHFSQIALVISFSLRIITRRGYATH